MTTLTLVAAPETEPVSVEMLQEHSRIDGHEQEVLLAGYLAAARQWCEEFTGRAFAAQTWDMTLGCWPAGDNIRLPMAPLQSVSSITYVDEDEQVHTLNNSSYVVITASEPGMVMLRKGQHWPSTPLRSRAAVTVRFVAGYDAEALPAPVRQAILLVAADLYEQRENSITGTIVSDAKMTAERLLWPYRFWTRVP